MDTESKTKFIQGGAANSVTIALSYYRLNYDSIWLCGICLVGMTFGILLLKLVALGELYHMQNKCFPPAYFFGFQESGRQYVYQVAHGEGFTTQDQVQVQVQNTDSINPKLSKILGNGGRVFNQEMQQVSQSVRNQLLGIFQEVVVL